MSGDPLSRKVSMHNSSSTESAPEVASRLEGKRATEPVHEAASTSGRFSEEEEDEVVLAVRTSSLHSLLRLVPITRQYDLEMVAPYELERPHYPPNGYIAVSETYLKFRVRFPLHPLFVEVLKYFGLTVFQITANR